MSTRPYHPPSPTELAQSAEITPEDRMLAQRVAPKPLDAFLNARSTQ